jgi:F-type H+-transporting ATPase subunit a
LILKLLVFVKSILKDNLVITKYSTYSYICIIFFFFLVANAIGMIPYSFTLTSSLIITFYVALMFFGGANILGLIINRLSILSLFIPKGVPIVIIPALVIIEIISYFSRVISLSVRLFANMMSGHTLLKILVGFLWLVIYNFFMIFVKFNIFSFLILFLP